MFDQPFTVVLEVDGDGIDPHGFPAGVDFRPASSGRAELVVHVLADDPVDALARAEYLIDGQPLTVATLRVTPYRENQPEEDDEGPLPVLVTVPEAAARLGISQQRVRQLIESRAGLHATKVGRDWLIRESDVTRRKARMEARDERKAEV